MSTEYELISVAEIRWTCPHCKGESTTLPYAVWHLTDNHDECWSCGAERLLIDKMLADGSVVWRQTPAMERTDSQA